MSTSRVPWSSSDDYLLFSSIIIIVGVSLFSYMAWSMWHTEISAFYLRAMIGQISLLHTSDPDLLRLKFQLQAAQYRPDLVRAVQLYYGLAILGNAVKWPVAILIAGMGGLCMWRAAPSRFAKALDLEGLIAVQAEMFPTLKGFVRRRLDKLVTPADGAPLPADPALTRAEWGARFAVDAQGHYSEVGALDAFTRQLGRHWSGVSAASPVEQVLLVAFAMHYLQKRQEALALLGDLSTSLADAGLDGPHGPLVPLTVPDTVLQSARSALKNGEIANCIETVCERSGWTVTALMTLLHEARRRAGVLAPPSFAIVKLIDRPLWYALHALGFPSEIAAEDLHPNPRIEAAGARAHWDEERRYQRPIYTPALESALAILRPTPEA
ncbi:secretion/conjugation apparatus DotM-related subunit [Acetobacter sicerae]|uniref:secretion/conjugation apparatus DotM-related subunit n=1 Tax=Acetobacter sicerae TaxID=85325 RepID=UPI00156B1162|nr:hypothetical protein [Acetobacter sicerae]NHN93160.1 hypothetical protein [Acetobacter sicerae]